MGLLNGLHLSAGQIMWKITFSSTQFREQQVNRVLDILKSDMRDLFFVVGGLLLLWKHSSMSIKLMVLTGLTLTENKRGRERSLFY